MSITVSIKQVYGNELIYPICSVAKAIARIAGKKTLSRDDIQELQSIGYSVQLEQATL